MHQYWNRKIYDPVNKGLQLEGKLDLIGDGSAASLPRGPRAFECGGKRRNERKKAKGQI
jgi:hypothetical protein